MCKLVENEIVIYSHIFKYTVQQAHLLHCATATVQSRIKTCPVKLEIIDMGLPQFYNIFLQSRTQSHAQHLTCERAYSGCNIDFPTHFQSLSFIVSHKIFHLPFIVPIIVVSIVCNTLLTLLSIIAKPG